MNYKILILIILSGICGGSVYPLIKIAESHAIPPFAYIFWESLFVVIMLSVISFYKSEKEIFRVSEWKYYLFCAATNIIIPQSLFFLIAPNLDASIMGLIIILTPLFVYLSLMIMRDINFHLIQFLGLLIGLIGAAILFLPEVIKLNTHVGIFWLAFGFLLPIDYTINRIFVSRFKPDDSPPYRLAIGLFSFVCVLSFFAMMVFGQWHNPFIEFGFGHLALVTHAFVMVIFYILFFVLANYGAIQNSLASYVIPVVALTWGVLLFDETPHIVYALSAVMIFTGLYLTNRKSKP